MAKLSTYALAGALAFALAPAAVRAADLPEPPLLEPVEPVEFGSSWYLRGDIGYKTYRNPDVRYSSTKFVKEDLDETGMVGGGVGYKFNNWIRADLTLDYEFKSDFKGRLFCPCAPGGDPFSREKAEVSAFTTLANVYFDLGTWHGFTPYVGAGAGASRIKVSDYSFVNPDGTSGSVGGSSNWDFSWALMAGVGFEVTDNLMIDAGYRYLNLGDGKTKSFNGSAIKFKDLEAHEVRVGFRYMID